MLAFLLECGSQVHVEKLPPEPRRHRRGGHGLVVFQYNCESLRAPDRLYELMALAKRNRAEAPCCPHVCRVFGRIAHCA